MISQKIKTLLYPILGLDLEPATPEGEARLVGDVQPTLAFLVAKGANGTVFVEATEDGVLKVADSGSGITFVEPFVDTSTDSPEAVGFSTTATEIWVKVETYPIDLAFQFGTGSWSADLQLDTGSYVFNISAQDIRINSEGAGDAATVSTWAFS
jgi:hypothetical protein